MDNAYNSSTIMERDGGSGSPLANAPLNIERGSGEAIIDNTTWYILMKRFYPPQEGFSEVKEF